MSATDSKLCAAAIAVVFLVGNGAFAQVPGGYREVLANDKDVAKATTFAIDAKNKTGKEKVTLVKVVKAEVQVVAGRNFRLTLDVADGAKSRRAVAVVWAKLDGTMELTSWIWPPDAKEKVEPNPK